MSVLQATGPRCYPAVSDHAPAAWLVVREAGPLEPPRARLLDRLRQAIRARHYSRRTEKAYVRAVLARVEGVPRLMAILLYGAGLRLLECCRLRVQDIDFAANQIVVRRGKGSKDRLTMLPAATTTSTSRCSSGP